MSDVSLPRDRAPRAGVSVTLLAVLFALTPGAMLVPSTVVHAQARDTSVRLADGAVVDITVRTGRLVVRGVDGSTGSVRAARGDYQLRSTGVTLVVMPTEGERNVSKWQDQQAIELDVPRGVRLVVSSLSADVEVRGITGGIDVRSTSGNLRLDDVGGRVFAEALSGDVIIAGTRTGALTLARVTTVSGDMQLREVRGDIDVRTTSGNLNVDASRITRFTAETMSGDVRVSADLNSAARVQVGTHSGDVTLRLPDEARGQLDHSTVTGELSAVMPLTLMPGSAGANRRGGNVRRYEFGPAAGSGGAALQLDISTFSGDVRLVRTPRS